jgi:hypothetical protein
VHACLTMRPKEALCLEFFYTYYKNALAEGPIFDSLMAKRRKKGGRNPPSPKGVNKREKPDEASDDLPVNGRLKHVVLTAI